LFWLVLAAKFGKTVTMTTKKEEFKLEYEACITHLYACQKAK
jgi:hypothetical protein